MTTWLTECVCVCVCVSMSVCSGGSVTVCARSREHACVGVHCVRVVNVFTCAPQINSARGTFGGTVPRALTTLIKDMQEDDIKKRPSLEAALKRAREAHAEQYEVCR